MPESATSGLEQAYYWGSLAYYLITGAAILTTAGFAYIGLNTWRKELFLKKKIDIVESFHENISKFENKLEMIRIMFNILELTNDKINPPNINPLFSAVEIIVKENLDEVENFFHKTKMKFDIHFKRHEELHINIQLIDKKMIELKLLIIGFFVYKSGAISKNSLENPNNFEFLQLLAYESFLGVNGDKKEPKNIYQSLLELKKNIEDLKLNIHKTVFYLDK